MQAASRPAIEQRLPLAKRGPVVRMSMQDHYVELTTAHGSELVLLRMADAVAEADPAGLRIHRSHWVHPAHVRRRRPTQRQDVSS